MALTADDVNDYYFHIAKGIDTIENFIAGRRVTMLDDCT